MRTVSDSLRPVLTFEANTFHPNRTHLSRARSLARKISPADCRSSGARTDSDDPPGPAGIRRTVETNLESTQTNQGDRGRDTDAIVKAGPSRTQSLLPEHPPLPVPTETLRTNLHKTKRNCSFCKVRVRKKSRTQTLVVSSGGSSRHDSTRIHSGRGVSQFGSPGAPT